MSLPIDFDFAAIRLSDEFSARSLSIIEGACRCALDVRSHILCDLDAEDDKWSAGEDLPEYVAQYRSFMAHAFAVAADCFGDHKELVHAVMSAMADEMGEPKILPWNGRI